jgi:LAO/AO transport system kinase
VLEIADMIAITKADGDNETRAKITASDYQHAMRIVTPTSPTWIAPVVTISSLQNKGLDTLWEHILNHKKLLSGTGEFEGKRRAQMLRWMWNMVEDRLMTSLKSEPAVKALVPDVEKDIAAGKLTPALAVDKILKAFGM